MTNTTTGLIFDGPNVTLKKFYGRQDKYSKFFKDWQQQDIKNVQMSKNALRNLRDLEVKK